MTPRAARRVRPAPAATRRLGQVGPVATTGGLAGLGALTGNAATGLTLAAAVLLVHLVVTVVIALAASRIAVQASKAGQDPVRLIQVLTALVRATR